MNYSKGMAFLQTTNKTLTRILQRLYDSVCNKNTSGTIKRLSRPFLSTLSLLSMANGIEMFLYDEYTGTLAIMVSRI